MSTCSCADFNTGCAGAGGKAFCTGSYTLARAVFGCVCRLSNPPQLGPQLRWLLCRSWTASCGIGSLHIGTHAPSTSQHGWKLGSEECACTAIRLPCKYFSSLALLCLSDNWFSRLTFACYRRKDHRVSCRVLHACCVLWRVTHYGACSLLTWCIATDTTEEPLPLCRTHTSEGLSNIAPGGRNLAEALAGQRNCGTFT